VNGQEVRGKLTDKTVFHTTAPDKYADMYKPLHDKGVNVSVKGPGSGTWSTWITTLDPSCFWLPLVLHDSPNADGENKAMSFGKSRAPPVSMQQKKIRQDVAGVDEAKETQGNIEFLREAQKFQKLGGRIPKGCCWSGTRKTGKPCWAERLLARPTCRSSRISGSDFVEMFGASALAACATCLSRGKKNALAFIFLDEIDAVGRHRGAGWARHASANRP